MRAYRAPACSEEGRIWQAMGWHPFCFEVWFYFLLYSLWNNLFPYGRICTRLKDAPIPWTLSSFLYPNFSLCLPWIWATRYHLCQAAAWGFGEPGGRSAKAVVGGKMRLMDLKLLLAMFDCVSTVWHLTPCSWRYGIAGVFEEHWLNLTSLSKPRRLANVRHNNSILLITGVRCSFDANSYVDLATRGKKANLKRWALQLCFLLEENIRISESGPSGDPELWGHW